MLSFVVLLTAGSLLSACASMSESEEDASTEESLIQVQVEEDKTSPEVEIRGQVIVIGPDGKKQEFGFDGAKAQDLMRKFRDGPLELNSRRMVIIQDGLQQGKDFENSEKESPDPSWVEERFVIGVQCIEADELLRIHLRLGDKGVVVINVRENTPAASGGLQKHDIIVSVDDRDVVSREDLTKAVLESEGKPLTLSVIRAGEPLPITVTPAKMQVPIVVASADTDEEQLKALTRSGKGVVRLQLVHPGILLERGIPRDEVDFRMMIEQFRKSLADQVANGQERHQNSEEQADNVPDVVPAQAEHLHESLKKLQDEMRGLQAELQELKNQMNSRNEKPQNP